MQRLVLALLRPGMIAKLRRLAAAMGLREAEIIPFPRSRRRPDTAPLSIATRSRPARSRRRDGVSSTRRTRAKADDPG